MPVTDLPFPRTSRAARRGSGRPPLRPPLAEHALEDARARDAGASGPSWSWEHRADVALGLLALLAVLLTFCAVAR